MPPSWKNLCQMPSSLILTVHDGEQSWIWSNFLQMMVIGADTNSAIFFVTEDQWSWLFVLATDDGELWSDLEIAQ